MAEVRKASGRRTITSRFSPGLRRIARRSRFAMLSVSDGNRELGSGRHGHRVRHNHIVKLVVHVAGGVNTVEGPVGAMQLVVHGANPKPTGRVAFSVVETDIGIFQRIG